MKKSTVASKSLSLGMGIAIGRNFRDNTGSSSKLTGVQLPPKKRKISFDFLVQECERQHQKAQNDRTESIANCVVVPPAISPTSADAIQSYDICKGSSDNSILQVSSNEEFSPSSSINSSKTARQEDAKSIPSKYSDSKKRQKKYLPERPMGADEVKAWRKEARRVRNRQSAAASREKIRNRIVVLESECQAWKTKYEEVMTKIRVIEGSGIQLNK